MMVYASPVDYFEIEFRLKVASSCDMTNSADDDKKLFVKVITSPDRKQRFIVFTKKNL